MTALKIQRHAPVTHHHRMLSYPLLARRALRCRILRRARLAVMARS